MIAFILYIIIAFVFTAFFQVLKKTSSKSLGGRFRDLRPL